MFVLQAAEDSVMVSYSFPAAVVKPGSYVSLVACYSMTSSYDRAWRKPNPNDFTVPSSHPCGISPQTCMPHAVQFAARCGCLG